MKKAPRVDSHPFPVPSILEGSHTLLSEHTPLIVYPTTTSGSLFRHLETFFMLILDVLNDHSQSFK